MTFNLGDVVVFKAFPNYKMVVLADADIGWQVPGYVSVGWFGHDKIFHDSKFHKDLLCLADQSNQLAEKLLQQIASNTDAAWGRQLARDYFKMDQGK
jgi:hypothetical protein